MSSAVLMDLSKVFDCISQDLLIAKLYLSLDTMVFLSTFLKNKKTKRENK